MNRILFKNFFILYIDTLFKNYNLNSKNESTYKTLLQKNNL